MKRNFSLLAAFLFALTLCLTNATNFTATQAQTAGAQNAEPESAAVARRALGRVPTARLGKIQDAKVREAAQRLVASLQAVANNKTAARENALNEAVERNHENLKLVLPTTPAAGCISEGVDQFKGCQQNCKNSGKRFCGCLIIAAADTLICIGGKLIP